MAAKTLKSFAAIPGPKSYPFVGTLWNYFPPLGKYRFDELHRNGLKKFLEFGPVVREEIVPGTNVVWIFTPEDIQELFRKEGRHPQRRSHLALHHYRSKKKELYNGGGLLPTNGPEWYRLRKAFQKGLSSLDKVRACLPLVDEIANEFVGHVAKTNPSAEKDFLPQLSRVFLEMLGMVAFDFRLDSFSEKELVPDSKSSKLIQATLDINSCILKTDNGLRLWRFWETPLYKRLKRAHEFMERVAIDLMENKIKELQNFGRKGKESSLLETYLATPEIDLKDLVGMAADMLLAGIDTISYSTGFLLYHLATNEEEQEKLFAESMRLLPQPDSRVTAEVLARAEHLKNSMKESFRLNPVSVGIGRVLSEDAAFSGYRVPKGNVVVTQNQVVCRMEQYFHDPLKFRPGRWSKNNKELGAVHPYLVLPFGHGPRTCIARRLAEQNIQTLVLKVCRNFKMEWNGGLLDSKSYLINKPDGPLKFSFRPRH